MLADLFAAPTRPAVIDEFRRYCQVRHSIERISSSVNRNAERQALTRALNSVNPELARFARARGAFGAPRFFDVYRR